MNHRPKIIVTQEDYERLEDLFNSRLAVAFSDRPYLRSLRTELSHARIVPPDDVPPNVVTMNSTVKLRQVQSQELETYTLVYPADADIAAGKLSVLAPVGTAILGYRVGDRVQWEVPGGMIRFRIEELIHQPERDGVVL